MKRIRLIIAALLTLAITAGMFAALGGEKAQAATKKPAKAKVTAKANDDGTSVTLTIAKTKNAQGYKIMVKKPGAKKFTKLATIKEDGTAKRTYTATKLAEGAYQFKVRAYLKNGKKTVWGKYSKAVKVTLKAEEPEAKVTLDPEIAAALDKYYPGLKKLAEAGTIGVIADPEIDEHEYITLGKWNYGRQVWSFNEEWHEYGCQYETDSKATPIEWMVLDYSPDGKSALIISRYVLGHLPYHNSYSATTWENCSARKWLNNDFFEKAFTEEEQKLVQLTTLKNPAFRDTEANGGNDTEDRIFYLSAEEAEKYFPDCDGYNGNKKYVTTSLDGQVNGWYLRTPGQDNETVMVFSGLGYQLEPYGFNVAQDEFCVRPACWITLTPEIIKENDLSLGKDKKEVKHELGKEDLYVTMGVYKDPWSGRNNILEWQILDYDEKNEKVLLLDRYITLYESFDISNNNSNEQNTDIIWEDCSLRKTLNGEFYERAFIKEEREIILKSVLDNKGNENYGRKGGNDTEDYIFLLSIEETEEYFGHSRWESAANRILWPRKKGMLELWTLRSPGDSRNTAAFVDEYGVSGSDPMKDIMCGARAAMWISIM